MAAIASETLGWSFESILLKTVFVKGRKCIGSRLQFHRSSDRKLLWVMLKASGKTQSMLFMLNLERQGLYSLRPDDSNTSQNTSSPLSQLGQTCGLGTRICNALSPLSRPPIDKNHVPATTTARDETFTPSACLDVMWLQDLLSVETDRHLASFSSKFGKPFLIRL